MSETKFDNLPQEVVENILDYVDPSKQQKLRRVSKFWDRNINSLYGAIVTAHNANLEFILESNACPIKAYFQNLTLPIPMNETETDFLNRLTSLTFSGFVVCYNIFPVLEKCIHVRKLDLILFNLNPQMKEYQLNMEDPSKFLPALRALSIVFDYEPFNLSNFTFLKNLLPFFTSENGKLTSITLDCPDEGGPIEISFDKIFKKNSFHQRESRVFDTPFDQSIPDEFYSELINSNFQTLRNLELADGKHQARIKMQMHRKNQAGYSEVQFSEFEHAPYSCLKVHDDHFLFGSTNTERITLFELLKPQTHLTKLSILILRTSTFTLDKIYLIADNNSGTLKCLTVNYADQGGGGPFSVVLDASLLSKLTVLKVFKFLNISSRNPGDCGTEETFARIINLNSLPTSLRVFSSSASLQFEQEDDFNMTVFERLENLKTFELTAMPFFQFGENKIYEMDSMKIRQLIAWIPSMAKLVLRNSRPAVPPIVHVPCLYYSGWWRPRTELRPRTDALPNSALDWINQETCISVHKLPIEFGGRMSYRNPNLIGQHSQWGWSNIPGATGNEFPVRFDANIFVDSEFRQRSTLLD